MAEQIITKLEKVLAEAVAKLNSTPVDKDGVNSVQIVLPYDTYFTMVKDSQGRYRYAVASIDAVFHLTKTGPVEQ
jgi:hypothetical protein